MSVAEVDYKTWMDYFYDAVLQYLDQGCDLKSARIQAAQDMREAFVCTDVEIAREAELDTREERDMDWTR